MLSVIYLILIKVNVTMTRLGYQSLTVTNNKQTVIISAMLFDTLSMVFEQCTEQIYFNLLQRLAEHIAPIS